MTWEESQKIEKVGQDTTAGDAAIDRAEGGFGTLASEVQHRHLCMQNSHLHNAHKSIEKHSSQSAESMMATYFQIPCIWVHPILDKLFFMQNVFPRAGGQFAER